MKTNIVIHEVHPETLIVLRVPESLVTTEELQRVNSIGFGYGDASDSEWAIYNKFAEGVVPQDDGTYLPGVEALGFPFTTWPNEQVFHIFFGL